MIQFRLSLFLIALAGSVATAQAAPPWARPDDDGRPGKGASHQSSGKSKARGDVFRDEDRSIVRGYYQQNPSSLPPGLARRGGNLPPGLAKRGGALPPGLAKNEVLPHELEPHLLPLPRELEIRLPPPPHEVIRRIIGRDLVLIHKRTHMVLDVLHDALP